MMHTGKHSVWRLAAAGVATLLAGLAAAAFWILARARYANDYCFTLVEQPESANPETVGGRPAYMAVHGLIYVDVGRRVPVWVVRISHGSWPVAPKTADAVHCGDGEDCRSAGCGRRVS